MTAPSKQKPSRPASSRPVPSGPSPRLVRTWLRVLHLVVGAALATYVYLPPDLAVATALRSGLMVVGVPAVVLTGLLMWRQAQARRLLRRLRSTPAPVPPVGR